ncbi:MAG: deoxynucleoside kinase, partial [Methylophilus sp.]
EQDMPREYIARLAEAYSEFFHTYDASPLLIVNNEKLNIIKDPEAFNLLIERINQIKSSREYFNPNF